MQQLFIISFLVHWKLFSILHYDIHKKKKNFMTVGRELTLRLIMEHKMVSSMTSVETIIFHALSYFLSAKTIPRTRQIRNTTNLREGLILSVASLE